MITKDDLVRLALEVTGLSEARWNALQETLKDDAAMNGVMREDWTRTPRESEQAIREYYRKSDIWFANTWNHGMGALLEMASFGWPGPLRDWHQRFIRDFKVQGRILDYGGGFFNDTYRLVTNGFKVTVAEVKGPVTEYLKRYRVLAKLEDHIDEVEVDSDQPLSETYTGVVCFETLEHLLKPLDMVKHFHDHLVVGQPFAFSVSFGDTPHAPYHVARNARLGDEKVFSEELEKIGFRPHWKASENHFQIWRAV